MSKLLSKKVFGVCLDPLAVSIPDVLLDLARVLEQRGVETEGLFRKSGKLVDIQNLKDQYDKNSKVDLDKVKDIHTIANLFKLYFRELPEPLCLYQNFDGFIDAVSTPDPKSRTNSIKKVLTFLPHSHKMVLKFLIQLLIKISKRSDVNKMTPENISIVFASNVLRPPPEEHQLNAKELAMRIMECTPHSNKLVQILIEEYDTYLKDFPDHMNKEMIDKVTKELQKLAKLEQKRQKEAKSFQEKLYKEREKKALKLFSQQKKSLSQLKREGKISGLEAPQKRDLFELSVAELVIILKKNNVAHSHCMDKYELVELAAPYYK
eukprot:TRINITY_DN12428_c0_g1_i1.p1 TRINITY_DN12428_c0_g1~~TRINITY_DN12428_c0_g1_i1.p1  ORF type:complete len:321 (-),score=55.40 TRINITY_DN12428_c0_g1_i1:84-1046(-)